MKRADQKMSLLAQLPPFTGIGRSQLLRVAGECELWDAPAGCRLGAEGETGGWWSIIAAGTATVSSGGVPTGLLGAGDWWGERSALNGDPATVTVVALTPVTVVVFSRRSFLDLLRRHPDVALRVISKLALRDAPYERLATA
jgi:CRP-like cAMP-binding protein